jgi:hypothetical protein
MELCRRNANDPYGKCGAFAGFTIRDFAHSYL